MRTYVSGIQMYLLLLAFLVGGTSILNPVRDARNDGWLAILLGGLCGLLLMLFYVAIARLNPQKTMVDILQDRLGKLPGNAVALVYAWYFVHIASFDLRLFGEFITTQTLTETPVAVVIGIFALVLFYVVDGGIEVTGRLSELLVPFIPAVFIISTSALVTTRDFTAFLPVLENGLPPVLLSASVFVTFTFGQAVVFLMIYPHLKEPAGFKKIVPAATVTMVLYLIMVFFRDLFVLGTDLMTRSLFSPHLTSVLIPGPNLDPLLDISLLSSIGIKTAICLYAAATALSQVLGFRDYTKVAGGVTILAAVLSLWLFGDIMDQVGWKNIWPVYSLPFQLLVPLVVLVLSLRQKSSQ